MLHESPDIIHGTVVIRDEAEYKTWLLTKKKTGVSRLFWYGPDEPSKSVSRTVIRGKPADSAWESIYDSADKLTGRFLFLKPDQDIKSAFLGECQKLLDEYDWVTATGNVIYFPFAVCSDSLRELISKGLSLDTLNFDADWRKLSLKIGQRGFHYKEPWK